MNIQTPLPPFLSSGMFFRPLIDFSVDVAEVFSKQVRCTTDFTVGIGSANYVAEPEWVAYDFTSPVSDETIIDDFGDQLWFKNTHIFFFQLAQVILQHRWNEDGRLQSEHLNNLFFLIEPDGTRTTRRIHLLPEHREINGSRTTVGGGGTPYPVGTRLFLPAS